MLHSGGVTGCCTLEDRVLHSGGVLSGFTMLLGLKPCHAYDPMPCLSGSHFLTGVPIHYVATL
jgi:hypothetical protein